jgi:hypothetical protein
MNHEQSKELPIGTILPSLGNVDNNNWIVCDGTELENIDSKFISLLEMDIGSIDSNNVYTSPNFNNMEFIDTTGTDYNSLVNEFNRVLKNDGHRHSFDKKKSLYNYYMENNQSIFDYDRIFIELITKKYKENLTNISTEKMKWIIKYR